MAMQDDRSTRHSGYWTVLTQPHYLLSLLNTVLPPASALHAAIARGTAFLLTVALAAMGLETDIRRLKARGLRPLALGALAAVFISGLAFALVQLVA